MAGDVRVVGGDWGGLRRAGGVVRDRASPLVATPALRVVLPPPRPVPPGPRVPLVCLRRGGGLAGIVGAWTTRAG